MTTGQEWRIGIDLGGTKISAILMHRDGTITQHIRTKTPFNDYSATLAAVATLVQKLQATCPTPATIGVGIPGSLNPLTGLVRNANSTWLNGRDLKADLTAHLKRPVRIANDANCFAVSEAHDGAGAGHHVVWGIIVGTGIGSGIVIDGRVLNGPLAVSGEWGHNPLPLSDQDEATSSPTPECWCGRQGCIESWLSGPAITADHRSVTGQGQSPEDIFASATAGEHLASQTVERHLSRLARAMAGVINIIDPDVIVMGGGIGARADLCKALPEKIAPHLFTDAPTRPDEPAVMIRPAQWGDDSGVRGAARLCSAQNETS